MSPPLIATHLRSKRRFGKSESATSVDAERLMLIVTREVGQSLLIEDVQLSLLYVDARSIVFAMTKLSGGRETKVQIPRHQIVDVCYDVKLQLLSVDGGSARLGLEHPESIMIQLPDGQAPPSN